MSKKTIAIDKAEKRSKSRFYKKKYRIINIMHVATGMPFNSLDRECSDVIKYCLNHKYNAACILGVCFGRLWANHTINEFNEFNENDFGGDGNFLGQ